MSELILRLEREGPDLTQRDGFGSQPFGASYFGAGAFDDRETVRYVTARDRESFTYKRRVSALADFQFSMPGNHFGWEGAEIQAWEGTFLRNMSHPGEIDTEDDAVVEVDGDAFVLETLRFRGRIEDYSYDTDSNITTFGGPGVGWELTNEEITVGYEHLPAWEALEIYLSDFSPFEGSVMPPEIEQVAEDKLVQEVRDVRSSLEENTSFNQTDPFQIRDGAIELLQASWTTDAQHGDYEDDETAETYDDTEEENDQEEETVQVIEDEAFSGGEGVRLTRPGDFVQIEFEPDYHIPQLRVGVRARAENAPATRVTLDGDEVDAIIEEDETLDLQWFDARKFGEDARDVSGSTEVRVEVVDTEDSGYGAGGPPDGHVDVDVIAPYDVRYSFSFPNQVDDNGYLRGPEPLPQSVTFEADRAETEFNVTGAGLETSWDHDEDDELVLNDNQSIALSNDDREWIEEENETDAFVDFADTYGYGVRVAFTLGRYGERADQTPTHGFKSHRLAGWNLYADMNDLIVIEDETVEDTHLSNIESLADNARIDFYIPVTSLEGDEEIIAFHPGQIQRQFPAVNESDFESMSTDRSIQEYANRVIVKGQRDEETGERVRGEAEDPLEIENHSDGVDLYSVIEPEITTATDAQARARRILAEKVGEAEFGGSISGVRPSILDEVDLDPGVAYQITRWNRYATLDAIDVTYDDSIYVDLDFAGISGPSTHILSQRAELDILSRSV